MVFGGGGDKSPKVNYTCWHPECGVVRAYLYSGSTLVEFHTAPDQPCSW